MTTYMALIDRLPIVFWLSCVMLGALAAGTLYVPLFYGPLLVLWICVLPMAWQVEVK